MAPPGSPEKIAVLTMRADLGQQLWHPDDVTLNASPRLIMRMPRIHRLLIDRRIHRDLEERLYDA